MKSRPTPLSSSNQEKLRKFIENKFEVKGVSGNEIRVRCTRCEDGDPEGHLYINIKYGYGHCFRCDFAPSFRKRLRLDEQSVPASAFEKAVATLKGEKRESSRELAWPDGFERLPSNSIFGKMAMKYLEKRNFDAVEVAERFRLGVCSSGKHLGRLVLPIFEDGKLVYYQTRTIIAQKPKFLNPEEDAIGRGKADYIFNLDAAAEEETMFLVEGFFDAMRLGDAGAAILGKSLSETQLEKLILADVQRIAVMLDPDAWKENLKLARQLTPYFETFICRLPKGFDPDLYISSSSKRVVKILSASLERVLGIAES